jgi:GH15 family glucan-1,4-alpha-glucosidase
MACTTSQSYLPNTNILLTTVTLSNGDSFQITDFCPRFEQYGRMYRPAALFRLVQPLQGTPAIVVSCRPITGWDKTVAPLIRGSNHLRYDIRGESLRLLTNMPLTYLCEETPVALTRNFYFGLTWGLGIEDDLIKVTHDFLEQTTRYWRLWVKHCSVPLLHQKEVIRSALALKLHCYEDTGAILAAMTTSLPEQMAGPRNWDYRYCWLRDAYFTLTAFNNLGHFEEMEAFLNFLLNIALTHEHSRDRLRPVYTLSQGLPLPEIEHANWKGYQGSAPVRSHNQADLFRRTVRGSPYPGPRWSSRASGPALRQKHRAARRGAVGDPERLARTFVHEPLVLGRSGALGADQAGRIPQSDHAGPDRRPAACREGPATRRPRGFGAQRPRRSQP